MKQIHSFRTACGTDPIILTISCCLAWKPCCASARRPPGVYSTVRNGINSLPQRRRDEDAEGRKKSASLGLIFLDGTGEQEAVQEGCVRLPPRRDRGVREGGGNSGGIYQTH